MAFQTMDEDVDRYKKLMGEWNKASQGDPGPQSAPRAPEGDGNPPRPTVNRPVRPQRLAGAEDDGAYSSGSILCLDDAELVIYRRPVAGKPLDMVYSLLADGAVKIDALDFSRQQVEEIGQLPPGQLKTLQAQMRWTRRLLAPYCFSAEDSERIPDPDADIGKSASQSAPQSSPQANGPRMVGKTAVTQDSLDGALRQESAIRVEEEPAPPSPGKFKVRRGQKLKIRFGDRLWEAVYWGRDTKGSVVAHNTHNHWSLMHLDLARYKETMEVDPEPDPLLIEQISLDLSTVQRQSTSDT